MTTPPHAHWQECYLRARDELDDTARLRALARSVREIGTATGPAGRIMAGAQSAQAPHRLGMIAGSFNPLTVAHVALADAARRQAQLDTLLWTCAVVTVDKERVERATLVDRLAQMSTRVRQRRDEGVLLLNRGLYADQAALAHHLLRHVRDLYVVVGFDKVEQIFDPRYYADRDAALRSLFGVARLLVSPRAGKGARELAELLGRPENRPFAAFVDPLDLPERFATDSSTEARALARHALDNAGPLRALVTPEGYALVGTHAFADPPDPRADAYAWRERWETVLGDVGDVGDVRDSAGLPAMAALVEACLRATPGAMALRAWLREATSQAEPSLARAIDLLGRV